ncbi:hypothetical protein [Mesorhizobium neociceri]|uniref:Uncharacterized protein n=1 Tax=Mesorhizobium neociceri TaxID=1307853 RepID=A0A838BA32_9HYPH|nr:hypothetical protein [Mesorhizobium neociceri]MBA1143063.1 hypothetical protein [Mesorhizobium neociceri]
MGRLIFTLALAYVGYRIWIEAADPAKPVQDYRAALRKQSAALGVDPSR